MRALTAVDLFAGCGGCTQGAVDAGIKVVMAANHYRPAVQIHANNFPGVDHWCQDLCQANFYNAPDHELMLASPCCQGHSNARGTNRPWHDLSRSTAWAPVQCLDAKRPKYFIIENVPEFRSWELYDAWLYAIGKLGYHVSENVIDAADLAVPQHRCRLFVVGAHNKVSKGPIYIDTPSLPHQGADTIIDWSVKKWSKVEGHAERTVKVIEGGWKEYGKRRHFLIPYYGSNRRGEAKGWRSLSRPLGSVTRKDRYALVHGNWMRMLTTNESRRAMAFPDDYILPLTHKDALAMLGNAVCPPVATYVMRHILQHEHRRRRAA